MKFLDEDISVTFTSIQSHSDGLYTYTIGRVDDDDVTILFIGKVFIPQSRSDVDIYLSDILNSFRYQNQFIKAYPESSSAFTTDLIQRYKVTLTVGATSYDKYADLCMMYRYPNRKNDLETEFTLNPIAKQQILLQGSKYVDNKWKLNLKPRIPYIDTEAFGFGLITENSQTGSTPIQYKGVLHGVDKTIYSTSQTITNNYFTLHDLFVNTTIDRTSTTDVFNLECGLSQVYDPAVHTISNDTFELLNGVNTLKIAVVDQYYTKWEESDLWTATESAKHHEWMFFGDSNIYYIVIIDEEDQVYALLPTGEIFRDENNLFTINITMRRGEDGAVVQIENVLCESQNVYLQEERLKQNEDDPTDAAFLDYVEATVGEKVDYTSFWYGHDPHCNINIFDSNGEPIYFSQDVYDTSQGSGEVDIIYSFAGYEDMWGITIGCLDDANFGFIEITDDEFYNPDNFFALTFHLIYEEANDEWYISDLSIKKTIVEPIDLSAPRVDYNNNDWFDVDECAAPYYLQWIDRYGSYQCQPFEGKSLFNEQVSRNRIQDFKGHLRSVQWSVNSKWTLNTGWINEDLYPYYESILVSPTVVLYDTKEDKAYNVIVTDTSYDEKTWKNQKKLFNFSLNVEIDKKQNILN